jgi:hypothetical protein
MREALQARRARGGLTRPPRRSPGRYFRPLITIMPTFSDFSNMVGRSHCGRICPYISKFELIEFEYFAYSHPGAGVLQDARAMNTNNWQ